MRVYTKRDNFRKQFQRELTAQQRTKLRIATNEPRKPVSLPVLKCLARPPLDPNGGDR
jgi:hypothetical protein